MYKTASRNLQKVQGRDVSRRFRMRDPKGRVDVRRFFFAVVLQSYASQIPMNELQKMPSWLISEVAIQGHLRWLEKLHKKANLLPKQSYLRLKRRIEEVK